MVPENFHSTAAGLRMRARRVRNEGGLAICASSSPPSRRMEEWEKRDMLGLGEVVGERCGV